VRQLLEVVPAVVPPGGGATSWTDVVGAGAAVLAALAGVVAALTAVGTLIATVGAVAVAVVAARYAKGQVDGARAQLEEARDLRREQAQPYVVVYAEADSTAPHFVDVVIKNLGATGAYDLRVTCSPTLMSADPDGGAPEVLTLPRLPFLAPGQEWRTFWDSTIEREEANLPDRYALTATYADSSGPLPPTPSVLDWSTFRHRTWLERKTVHHAAASIAGIETALKGWVKSDKVIRVATYDGPERDAHAAEQREQRRRQHEYLAARLTASQPEEDQS
jgi:hypothetical protein